MYLNSKLISARRESVIQSYNSARAENLVRFLEGDDRATSECIYPNQLEDAASIVNSFYINKCRVNSVQKKTKVGADGQIYLDKVEHRIIVSVYYGSKNL
jgi:hypothetical protein